MDNTVKRCFIAAEVVCVIPTLNEVNTISDVITKAKQFSHRVIVVDGGSVDGTYRRALAAGAEVIIQDGTGKGDALRTVFNKINGDIYVIIDGDSTYEALEMERLVKPILEGKADMVIGSRLRGIMEKNSMSGLHKFGNRFFTFLINFLFNGKLSDSQSGFRALNRKAIKTMNLSSEGFEIETEIAIKALKRRLRINEVPIVYLERRGSQSKLSSFSIGLKILNTILCFSVRRDRWKHNELTDNVNTMNTQFSLREKNGRLNKP